MSKATEGDNEDDYLSIGNNVTVLIVMETLSMTALFGILVLKLGKKYVNTASHSFCGMSTECSFK